MAIADALVPEFDHEMTTTRKLLERVPEDKFDWKPHAKSFSLGALATHVATLPGWGAETLNKSEIDVSGSQPPSAPASRTELLATFDKSVATTRAEGSGLALTATLERMATIGLPSVSSGSGYDVG